MHNYILFHHFKHHLNHLKAWVATNKSCVSSETVLAIKTLGSSQLDMYCGALSIDEIKQQAADFLLNTGITTIDEYRHWVGNSYKLFTLSDGSSFTMRYLEHATPIHIHPSRHTQHTIRIKANALKSAVGYLLTNSHEDDINIQALNNHRKQHLHLSPIAGKQDIAEIIKAMQLLKTTIA